MFQRERERRRALPLGRYSSAPWGAGIPGPQWWRLSPKAACLRDGCWGWGRSEDDDGRVLKRSCFGGPRRLLLLANFLRPSPEPCFLPRPPCGLVMASVHLHPNPGSAGRNGTEGIGPGPLGDGCPGLAARELQGGLALASSPCPAPPWPRVSPFKSSPCPSLSHLPPPTPHPARSLWAHTWGAAKYVNQTPISSSCLSRAHVCVGPSRKGVGGEQTIM